MSSVENSSLFEGYMIEDMPQLDVLCSKIPPELFQQSHYKLLEACDGLGVKNETKYLAMVAFIKYISCCDLLNLQTLRELVYASIFMACEVKEDLESLQCFIQSQNGQNILSHSDTGLIQSLKSEIGSTLGDAIHLSTPYDMVKEYCDLNNVGLNCKSLFDSILNFVLSLPMFCEVDALRVYLSCRMVVYSIKQDSAQLEILHSEISNQMIECVDFYATVIENQYQELLESEGE